MVNRIEGQVSTSVEFTYPFSLTAFNKALNMSVGLQVLLSFVILFRFARFLTGLQTSCVGQFGFPLVGFLLDSKLGCVLRVKSLSFKLLCRLI